MTRYKFTRFKKMVRVWKTKSLLFYLRYLPSQIFMFPDLNKFWPIKSLYYLIFEKYVFIPKESIASRWLLSKVFVFTGSQFHLPRKDLGRLLTKVWAIEFTDSGFPVLSSKKKRDGGRFSGRGGISRGCIWSILSRIHEEWIRLFVIYDPLIDFRR